MGYDTRSLMTYEEEVSFANHIKLCGLRRQPITREELREVAHEHLCATRGEYMPKPSQSWATRFLQRNPTISTRKASNMKRMRADMDSEEVMRSYITNLQESMTDDDGNIIPPHNMMNFDETNFS